MTRPVRGGCGRLSALAPGRRLGHRRPGHSGATAPDFHRFPSHRRRWRGHGWRRSRAASYPCSGCVPFHVVAAPHKCTRRIRVSTGWSYGDMWKSHSRARPVDRQVLLWCASRVRRRQRRKSVRIRRGPATVTGERTSTQPRPLGAVGRPRGASIREPGDSSRRSLDPGRGHPEEGLIAHGFPDPAGMPRSRTPGPAA
jgi:hypothetical protein